MELSTIWCICDDYLQANDFVRFDKRDPKNASVHCDMSQIQPHLAAHLRQKSIAYKRIRSISSCAIVAHLILPLSAALVLSSCLRCYCNPLALNKDLEKLPLVVCFQLVIHLFRHVVELGESSLPGRGW